MEPRSCSPPFFVGAGRELWYAVAPCERYQHFRLGVHRQEEGRAGLRVLEPCCADHPPRGQVGTQHDGESLRRFMQAEHSSKAYRLSERDFGVSTVVGAGVPLSSPDVVRRFHHF
jgi:hypothetical protein